MLFLLSLGCLIFGFYQLRLNKKSINQQINQSIHRSGCMSSETFLAEANLMRNFVDANVVRLLGVVTKDEPYLIVTEFMDGGDLLSFLTSETESLPRKGGHSRGHTQGGQRNGGSLH